MKISWEVSRETVLVRRSNQTKVKITKRIVEITWEWPPKLDRNRFARGRYVGSYYVIGPLRITTYLKDFYESPPLVRALV